MDWKEQLEYLEHGTDKHFNRMRPSIARQRWY
jgi:hypothetical protein